MASLNDLYNRAVWLLRGPGRANREGIDRLMRNLEHADALMGKSIESNASNLRRLLDADISTGDLEAENRSWVIRIFLFLSRAHLRSHEFRDKWKTVAIQVEQWGRHVEKVQEVLYPEYTGSNLTNPEFVKAVREGKGSEYMRAFDELDKSLPQVEAKLEQLRKNTLEAGRALARRMEEDGRDSSDLLLFLEAVDDGELASAKSLFRPLSVSLQRLTFNLDCKNNNTPAEASPPETPTQPQLLLAAPDAPEKAEGNGGADVPTKATSKPKRGRKVGKATVRRADFAKPLRENGETWPNIFAAYERQHYRDTEATEDILRRAFERQYPELSAKLKNGKATD